MGPVETNRFFLNSVLDLSFKTRYFDTNDTRRKTRKKTENTPYIE